MVSFFILRTFVRKKGRLAGKKNEPVDEERIEEVYHQIEDMIPDNTETVYFVVERKGQETNVPPFKASILRGIQQVLGICGFKEKRQVFDYRIMNDIFFIIKMKGGKKGIRVCEKTQ
jgi:hypothetical protein